MEARQDLHVCQRQSGFLDHGHPFEVNIHLNRNKNIMRLMKTRQVELRNQRLRFFDATNRSALKVSRHELAYAINYAATRCPIYEIFLITRAAASSIHFRSP